MTDRHEAILESYRLFTAALIERLMIEKGIQAPAEDTEVFEYGCFHEGTDIARVDFLKHDGTAAAEYLKELSLIHDEDPRL